MAMYVIFSNAKELKIENDQIEKDYCKINRCYVIKRYYSNTPKVQYTYTFENGFQGKMNPIQAKIYAAVNETSIESGGPLHYSTFDMYQGYNPAFGMYIDSRTQHKRELKKRNLIEMGNEHPSKIVDKVKHNPLINDDDLKDIVGNMGASISGNEAEALKSGKELHKNYEVKEDKIDLPSFTSLKN